MTTTEHVETLTGTSTSPIAIACQNRIDDVRAKIAAVAAAATEADRKLVKEIIEIAARGEYCSSKVCDLTPGVQALIFLEHNPYNRDWNPNVSLEYARRQSVGIWRQNNACPGFYKDATLADSQHRLGAGALSGFTWRTIIVFGMDRDSVTTIDDGAKRTAAAAAKMKGMRDSTLKQTVVKAAARYMLRLGCDTSLHSTAEVEGAMQANNGVLTTAIEIAETSGQNLVNPVLKTATAATVAYLGLTHGWPEQRVREKLALFQTGQSVAGEQEPFFLAGQIIEKARQKADARERLSSMKEVGLVFLAFQLSTQGVRATTRAKMLSAIKDELPKIDYPGELPVMEAAE